MFAYYTHTMVRPLIPNREAVKGTIFTMKLTGAERELLRQLVAQREGELAELTGQRLEVAASAFVRWLFIERAKHVGIPAEVPRANGAPSVAPPTPAPAKRKAKAPADVTPPTAERVRAAVAKLVEGGVVAKTLAEAAHVDAGALSKFRKGGTLGEAKLEALWATCSRMAG